jgi:hypothetical protein
MKKILLFSLTFILIMLPNTSAPAFVLLAQHKPCANYSFYVSGQVFNSRAYYVIDNAGLGSIVNTNAISSSKVKPKLDGILGESMSFEGSIKQVFNLLRFYKATIVKAEHIDSVIYSVYASSNAFKNSILIDNKKVNLQICYNSGKITIGSPIILGDY